MHNSKELFYMQISNVVRSFFEPRCPSMQIVLIKKKLEPKIIFILVLIGGGHPDSEIPSHLGDDQVQMQCTAVCAYVPT
jgi:hypothetical protein